MELHPIIAEANKYANDHVPDTDDPGLDRTKRLNLRDDYLFAAARGIYLQVKEVQGRQDEVDSPFDLRYAHALLKLITTYISGYSGSLAQNLVYSGVAGSQQEVEHYFFTGNLEKFPSSELLREPIPMIGIVGKICSGKGSVGKILTKKFDGYHLALSNRLREVSLSQMGSVTFPREELRAINDFMKPLYGDDVFVRWTIEIAQNYAHLCGTPLISIDGFRSVKEAQTFKERGGVLIGIQAEQSIRFQRLVERGRPGDDNWEMFLASDDVESKWIDPIFELCDYHIDNNTNVTADLEQKIDKTFEQIQAA